MRVGLIINNGECGRWESFKVVDGKAYTLDNTLYNGPTSQDGIDGVLFRNIWNRPFMGTGGYFIKHSNNMPDVDLDVIFIVYETVGNPTPFVDSIRSKYPKAKIIGTTKEAIPGLDKKPVTNLQKLFSLCDSAAIQFNEEICAKLTDTMGIKIHSLPVPYNLEYMREKYKTNSVENTLQNNRYIVAGSASWDPERGYDNCLDIANYLGEKYGYEVVKNYDNKSWHEWLELINNASFVINTDTQHRLGQVTIESIALGTPHLGGLSDTIKTVIPTYATNSKSEIESIFIDILENGYPDNYYYSKLEERYNFRILNKKLKGLL